MNVLFINVESNKLFSEQLAKSTDMQNWLIDKMSGYNHDSAMTTIEIMIDPYDRNEVKTDFCWGIYRQEVDNYNEPVGEKYHVINGGLIYRGIDEKTGKLKYTSHT